MADDPQALPPAPPGFNDVPATPAGFTDVPKPALSVPYPDDKEVPGNANQEAYAAVSNKLFQQTPPGKLAAVVSQAFKLDEPLGLAPETVQSMKDAGIFNDQAKGQFGYVKDFGETILRSAAVVGDAALRAMNAAVVLPVGAVGAAVNPTDAGTNAYQAQQFNDDLMMVLATEGLNIPHNGPPTPPSAQRNAVVEPKPWQADIDGPMTGRTPEEIAKTGGEYKSPPPQEPPPITNKPQPGTPEAKELATVNTAPANPSDPIQHSSPVLDGSGNLNLNYIRADQDTKDIMAQTADAYAQQYGSVQTHVETVEQGNAAFDEALKQTTNGIPDVLLNYMRGDRLNTNDIWTARNVSVQLANQAAKLAKTGQATGTPEDEAAFQEMFSRMVHVVGPIRHEMTAEPGRMLNSFQIPVGENGGPVTEEATLKLAGLGVKDAMRIMATFDAPQQVAKFVADIQKPSFTDMGLYYIFNNYLSGPITHLAYAASWGIQTVIRAGLETPVASMVGKIQGWAGKTLSPEEVSSLMTERTSLVDRLAEADSTQGRKLTALESQEVEGRLKEINDTLKNATTVMPHEAAARFYGIGEGALDSIRAFGRALKTADIQMLPGEMAKADTAAKEAEAAALKAGATAEDAKAAAKAAYQDASTNFGNPIVSYGKQMKSAAGGKIVQGVGEVIGAPMRVIAAIHSLQKFSGYAESMSALAYRQAATEGLEGESLANRIAAIKNNPSPEMMQQAADEAKYAALMGKSGGVGQKFQSLANANAWTRVVVPFSKVVTNLTSQKLLERTPVGLLSEVVRGNIMGANGNAAQATQISKMLVGSTLLTGGAYLAAQGVNRGWGSDDKNERAFQYLSGNPPYSVTIGDINLPHRFFGVAGGSLSLGADIHDIAQVMTENEDGWNDWLSAMGASIHYIGRDLLSENALTGPAELYNAINDRQNAAKHFVPNAIASAFVPYSSFQSQMNSRFIDPIMRQTMGEDSYDSIMQTIQARTPVYSKELMPKVDIFGNPMRHENDHTWAEKDPVMQALQHLDIYPAAVTPKLFGVALDEKQFADYATVAGKAFYGQLLPQVSNPNWVRLTDKQQADVIQAAIKTSRAQARGTMSLLYPQIVKDSAQQKVDLLHKYDETEP